MKSPRCIIIAGPNGAGKTTFAREFLPQEAVIHFVNADLLAAGLSPLKPSLAALSAGRLFLVELDRLAKSRQSFAFESTLSGLTYISRLKRWKAAGYQIEIAFLRLASAELALRVSGREDTMCPSSTFCADSIVDGRTSKMCINHWQINGKCTTIPVRGRCYRKAINEAKKSQTCDKANRDAGASRPPARRLDRPQDRPHVRHPDLHLARRQSRRRETLNTHHPLGVFGHCRAGCCSLSSADEFAAV